MASVITALPIEPSRLGESPLWHPGEAALYWCDIPGRALNRFEPLAGRHRQWKFDGDVGCCAPIVGGGMLLALRDGLWRCDLDGGDRMRLAAAPYDPASERFNDGKADPHGRMWVGTIYEPRDRAAAAMYCYDRGKLQRKAEGITVSNGLAWSPDARAMYWADTKAHTVFAFDFDVDTGGVSNQRVFARFDPRTDSQALDDYRGRPDGAAVDADGCLWLAMYEGARIVRLAPSGVLLGEIALPVRCPTMPCFGGADLKTLYVTSARDRRPAAELAAMPWSGCVLSMRVDTPGLPVNFARL